MANRLAAVLGRQRDSEFGHVRKNFLKIFLDPVLVSTRDVVFTIRYFSKLFVDHID